MKPKKQKLIKEPKQNTPKPSKPTKTNNIVPVNLKMLANPDEITRKMQLIEAQARMRQLHQSAAMLHTTPRAALAAAANILPAQFGGISPDVLSKMTQAQMQALLLRYTHTSMAPPLSLIRATGTGLKITGW